MHNPQEFQQLTTTGSKQQVLLHRNQSVDGAAGVKLFVLCPNISHKQTAAVTF